MPDPIPTDLQAKARELVDFCRQQNWKNGGCLVVDREDAEAAILAFAQSVREAAIMEAADACLARVKALGHDVHGHLGSEAIRCSDAILSLLDNPHA